MAKGEGKLYFGSYLLEIPPLGTSKFVCLFRTIGNIGAYGIWPRYGAARISPI